MRGSKYSEFCTFENYKFYQFCHSRVAYNINNFTLRFFMLVGYIFNYIKKINL
jgi:hypothetical protein